MRVALDMPNGSICACGHELRDLYHIEFVKQTYRIFRKENISISHSENIDIKHHPEKDFRPFPGGF